MPAYAYPIIIDRNPKEINFQDTFEINEPLTLKLLSKYVKEDEIFYISEIEDGRFSSKTILIVNRKRLETQEELQKRIKKEEKYMEEYNKRKNK